MKKIIILIPIFIALFSYIIISSPIQFNAQELSTKNIYDQNLDKKLSELKKEIESKNLNLEEVNEIFSKQFKNKLEGVAKVHKIIFENGNTAIVITESPLPIKILFKGQFLLNKLGKKENSIIKFKVSKIEIVKEPILRTLRVPITDIEYWIYLTFSDYGEGFKDDYVDDIKILNIKNL